MGMMGYGFGGPSIFGGLWMGMAMLFHIVFFALIVMGCIWLFKAIFRTSHQVNGNIEAIAILKQRYAKGEIDRDQYEQMKKDLE